MRTAPPEKTNAVRLLDRLGIAYELLSYTVDESDLTAISVAHKIGMPPEQVFKTLLTCSMGLKGEPHRFAIIPGDSELDLKKLAAAAGAKKSELAPLKDVEPLTGYVRGAVTVLAARRDYPAFADESIELFNEVSVSAGLRGLQLVLAPGDYLQASQAVIADLTRAVKHP